MTWKNYSRKCAYCGKSGPRTPIPGGWAHKRCLPPITPPKSTDGVKGSISHTVRPPYPDGGSNG